MQVALAIHAAKVLVALGDKAVDQAVGTQDLVGADGNAQRVAPVFLQRDIGDGGDVFRAGDPPAVDGCAVGLAPGKDRLQALARCQRHLGPPDQQGIRTGCLS